jgi:hypothetical protein
MRIHETAFHDAWLIFVDEAGDCRSNAGHDWSA